MLLGDCDDFAVECLDRLLNLGTPRNALRLAVCRTETGQLHLVLLAHTDDGEHALDNRQSYVQSKADLPYRWLWTEPYRASA
jgi:predicted transglutaminase-like cysteine proteinase